MKKYNKRRKEANIQSNNNTSKTEVRHTLDEHIRKAIQEKLPELLEEEIQEYIGRQWYERHSEDTQKQYRNGYGKQRRISRGCGTISLRVPRLREQYDSKIIRRYQRMTDGIRSLDTGEERDLTPDLNFFLGPRWSPDGRSILLVGFDRQRRPGVFRMDAESGVVTPVVQSDVSVFPVSVEWARGGKAVVFRREPPGLPAGSIVVRDLETGREEEIYHAPAGSSVQGFALSPDGLQVAFRSYDEAAKVAALNVVPVTGGVARELLRAGKDEIPGGTPLGACSTPSSNARKCAPSTARRRIPSRWWSR